MSDVWCDRIRLTLRPIVLAVPLLFLVPSMAAVQIEEEIVEQEYPVDPAATLSIQNTDGSIRVYAGNAPKVSIQAIKKAYTSDRLKSIGVSVQATPKSVAIKTILPPKKSALSLNDRSGTVDYIITVPQTMRITKLDLVNGEILIDGLLGGSAAAHLVNGWVSARNCLSDLNLAVESGRLEVEYDYWENAKFSVKLSIVHGGIRALIPSDASARIVARTATGRIENAFAPEEDEESEPVRTVNFAIEPEPEAAFEMNATDGNITIEKPY